MAETKSLLDHIAAGVFVLALAACSGVQNPTAAPAAPGQPAPGQSLPEKPPLEFYELVPDRDSAAPGQLIARFEIQAPPGMRAWTVLYSSSGLDGKPVPVSGVVIAPAGPSWQGHPVVAFAHGTTGIADQCAPSLAGLGAIPNQVLGLVKLGYVVSATDYQGLGTDGIHPYMVGVAEGRSVLDSIVAAQNLRDAHAADRAVIIGHSQGGHAALWAGQLAPTYAARINLEGVVSASPPIDLMAIDRSVFQAARAGHLETTIGALRLYGVWSEVYHLPLHFLTQEGRLAVRAEFRDCEVSPPTGNPYVSDPASEASWRERMIENSPGSNRVEAAILVVAPQDDEVVPWAGQMSGVTMLCAAGDVIDLRTPTGDHSASMWTPYAWGVTEGWIHDRFAGRPVESTCR
jgi:pimeloyl-ACP methyl ester carboxylesterase